MAGAAVRAQVADRWRSVRLAGQIVASVIAVPLLGLAAMLPVSALFALVQGLFVPFLVLMGVWLVIAPLAWWIVRKAHHGWGTPRAVLRARRRAWRDAF
jgi:hypothetical protein